MAGGGLTRPTSAGKPAVTRATSAQRLTKPPTHDASPGSISGSRNATKEDCKEVSECIYVGVRLRPPSDKDSPKARAATCEGNIVTVEGNGRPRSYEFDVVLDSSDPDNGKYATQQDCFDRFGQRMVDHVIEGFTSTLFAYGQTGSGKTTTIMGNLHSSSEQGILPRQLTAVFDKAASMRGTEIKFTLQMLEVYNEQLGDLLCTKASRADPKNKPKIHVHPKVGVFVTDCVDAAVENCGEALKLLEYGNAMKAVASTGMNHQSSRGHTVFRLHLEQTSRCGGGVINSNLYMVDLAGRENEKTTSVKGMQLVELGFINKSLMFLAACIKSLGAKGQKPTEMSMFRNSKLTLLLSNALSGNSRTALIAALHPEVDHVAETVTTLNFAATAKNIQVTSKAAEVVNKDVLIKDLKEEVRQLQEQLKTCLDDSEAKRLKAKVEAQTKLVEKTNWENRRRYTVMTLKRCEERLSRISLESRMRASIASTGSRMQEAASRDDSESEQSSSSENSDCNDPQYHKDALEKALEELWGLRSSEQRLRAERKRLKEELEVLRAASADDHCKLEQALDEKTSLETRIHTVQLEREATPAPSVEVEELKKALAEALADKATLQEKLNTANAEIATLRKMARMENVDANQSTKRTTNRPRLDPLKCLRDELGKLRNEMTQVWTTVETGAALDGMQEKMLAEVHAMTSKRPERADSPPREVELDDWLHRLEVKWAEVARMKAANQRALIGDARVEELSSYPMQCLMGNPQNGQDAAQELLVAKMEERARMIDEARSGLAALESKFSTQASSLSVDVTSLRTRAQAQERLIQQLQTRNPVQSHEGCATR